MKKTTFWLRWSVRDLRDRWLLVCAIAATIALGTGLYAGLESMSSWRKAADTESLAQLAAHDVRLDLASGSFATPEQLAHLLSGIPHASSVAGSQERLVLPTRVDASTSTQTIVVPGQLVGTATADPSTDRLQVRGGRPLTTADDGQPVAELEYHFAAHYDLPTPQTISVGDGQKLTAVGRAFSSDYLLVISPSGDLMAEASYAVVFVPLDTAGRISGHQGMVNELVVRLSDPSLALVVRDELRDVAAAEIPNLGPQVVVAEDEPSRRWLDKDAGNDEAFFSAFSLLILGGAAFAAFNLTSRIVESQRRQIGIGLALGLPARSLAIRPVAVAAEIALLGIVFGVGVGSLINLGLQAVFAQMLPMPVFSTPFEPDVFGRAALLGFCLPFAASFYPIWRAVLARPIDSIRTGYLSAQRPGLARFARRLPLPGLVRLPLSNVLRTPRRTVLTALGIGAAVAVLVGTIGMLDTYGVGIERGQTEMLAGSPDRIAVDFAAPMSTDALRTELAVPGAGPVDTILRLPVAASLPSSAHDAANPIDLQLDVLDVNGGAWQLTLAQGHRPSGPGEIILTVRAASDLGLRIGDRFALRHPVRESDTAVTIQDSWVVLVGTDPSPMRPTAYMDVSGASLFGMDGLANRATVVPAPGADKDALRRTLFGLPGVISAQPVDALVTAMRDLVGEFTDVLSFVALIALLLAFLVAYNSATISQDERRREVATMLAFGLPIRKVLGSAVVESGLIGILGTLVGIGGGFLALTWLVYGLLPTSMPDFALDPAISVGTVLTAVLLGVVAVALAPVLGVRRLTRMDLPATLRVVE